MDAAFQKNFVLDFKVSPWVIKVIVDGFVKSPISAWRFPALDGIVAEAYRKYASLHEIHAP